MKHWKALPKTKFPFGKTHCLPGIFLKIAGRSLINSRLQLKLRLCAEAASEAVSTQAQGRKNVAICLATLEIKSTPVEGEIKRRVFNAWLPQKMDIGQSILLWLGGNICTTD